MQGYGIAKETLFTKKNSEVKLKDEYDINIFTPEVIYRITKISIAPVSVKLNVYAYCWFVFYFISYIKYK